MRYFSLFFLLASLKAAAQLPEDYCKQIKDIARFEQMAHQRIAGNGNNSITNAISNNFDVKYYRCEWEVDPAVRYINGKVTVYYVVLQATNNIQLDLMSPLVVDSVKQRGTQLTKTHASNVVTINFPSTVTAGVLDSVTVYYKGVPFDSGFGSFDMGTHAGVPVQWTLSEPYGSRDWWPCKNGLDDKADSIDIFVTCPAAYKAAANGILQSETLIAGGTKKVAWWKHRYPIASYLVCYAVTNYAVFNNSVTIGSTVLPMQTYCYPENQASFQSGTQNTLDALKLYHNTFGDYPFIKEKIRACAVQLGRWHGAPNRHFCGLY